MDSISLNYSDSIDSIDGLEMIKLIYESDSDETLESEKKRQKKDIPKVIQEVLDNIEKIELLNENNYIKQCMDYVPYYPKFIKSENLPIIIDYLTDFQKLKENISRYHGMGFGVNDEIKRFLKYTESVINHAHYEHNLKLIAKNPQCNIMCSCCDKSQKCFVEKNIWGYFLGSKCKQRFMLDIPKNIEQKIKLQSVTPMFRLIKI